MRPVCYSVAISLDGYIAGPKGEADWIVMDPEIDFKALFAGFDTLLPQVVRGRTPAGRRSRHAGHEVVCVLEDTSPE